MSDEAQRMTALKSAYADIILNTTKESATRILASERRALQLQQSLSIAKEDSLAILLRLKAIMEAKIIESEKENLSQARKIEELEVQLREANVMIHHLKSEIRRLNSELDHQRDIEAKFLDGKKPRDSISCMKYNIQEDIDKSDSYLHFPNEHEIIKNSSCCFTKDVMRHESMGNLARSDHFGGNLDLASMTPNNKKPEFYQNGCIHRAQAFKQVHDQKSNPTTMCVNKKAERAFPPIKRIRRRNTRQRKFIVWPTNSDTLHDMQHCGLLESSYSMVRESDIDGSAKDMNSNGIMAPPNCSALASEEDQESIQNQKSNLNTSFGETSLGLLDGNGVMKSETILKACNSTCENRIARSYTSSRITCQENSLKEPLIMNASVVIDDSVLDDDGKNCITEQEMSAKSCCKVAEDLSASVTKIVRETVNAPVGDHKDEPCRSTEPYAVVRGAKLLKYTFQRKRKRGPMDTKAEFKSLEEHVSKKKAHKGNEENMSPRNVDKDEENVSTRKMDDDNVLVENQKSSMAVESSRDSRRMAQVARQLISLSERRRW